MLTCFREKWAAWQAYKVRKGEEAGWKRIALDWTETIVIAGAFALFIRQYFLQTSWVYSGSMIPTMAIKDRLIVTKTNYWFKGPKLGDIALFMALDGSKKEVVKRVVAGPGDRISIERGIVWVNGVQQVFPGVVILKDYSSMDEITVPEAHYFMMGDNRANSADSRIWGPVPETAFIGRGIFTFWPLGHAELLR